MMGYSASGHVAMASRFLIAWAMLREGSSRLLRSPSAHNLPAQTITAGIDAISASDTSGQKFLSALGFSGYHSANRSLTAEEVDALILLAESTQWHGDIFNEPEERTSSDLGLPIFTGAQKAEWTVLGCAVLVLLLVDALGLRRFLSEGKEGTGVHLLLLAFWVICGIGFNFVVLARNGQDSAIQWCSSYLLEWLLSMDNLFVFHLIFRVYATPKELLHKALFLGIVGAVVFRMCFFMALASLLNLIHWVRFVFGVLLIYSGVQAARDDDDDLDISNLLVVRWLKRFLGTRLVEKYDLEQHRMFILEDGEWKATLLVPVIFCLEVTDIIFAVDSVSAKVAQIPDYYIAYSSSVLAMFGLRAMFFIIRDLVDVFDMLKYGLCFILVFIGIELLVEDYVKLPAQAVCAVVLSVFIVCTAGSTARKLFQQRSTEKAEGEPRKAQLPVPNAT